MLIGLSLSFCIRDIVDGLISPDEVLYIISSTAFPNEKSLIRGLESYSKYYWSNNPILGKQIALSLYNEGRLLQPRLHNAGDGHNIADGHWARVLKFSV